MKFTVIGMISGTSYDAVDAAAAEFELDGDEVRCVPRGLYSEPVPDDLRARIAAALPPHPTTLEEVCRLDTEIGQLLGRIGATANERLADGRADFVVSHGQTVYHWVDGTHALGTLQLGAAAWVAEATGVATVSDLRTRDITRGGHAAPLASTLDAVPNLTFVVNHLGGPVPTEATPAARAAIFDDWRHNLREVARRPNVVLKVGGVGMPVYGFGLQDGRRPDSATLTELWRPYIEAAVETFGPERCMFESNFPMDKMSFDSDSLWNAFKRLSAGYSPAERTSLFSATARGPRRSGRHR